MQSATNSKDASAATAVRKTAPTIDAETDDRHSLVLLLSLLFFLVLSAFVRDDWISEVVLALAAYAILVVAILKISGTNPAVASASRDGFLPRRDDHLYPSHHAHSTNCKLADVVYLFWLCLLSTLNIGWQRKCQDLSWVHREK